MAPEIPVLARDQAFELLYRRYVKDVYHYALALLRNPADAEDVTQTTFMNAYRAYKRNDAIEKPQNWLITIAHNVARTRFARASRRVREVPLEDHLERLAIPEEEKPNVEGVLRALGRLPFNQRAALVMRELEGRTYAEIADTIGVSVPAVETLIFRARKALRLRAAPGLQSLAAVPLPSSLARLFEGGGVAAGGGGMLGTGFLGKAAVVVLAGAVATGVGGQHTGGATAALPVGSVPVASAPTGSDLGIQLVPGTHAAVKRPLKQRALVGRANRLATKLVAGTHVGAAVKQLGPVLQHPAATLQPAVPTPSVPTPAQVVETVTSVVNSVETTVEAPAVSLPVQAPNLPTLPAEAPAAPKLP